MLITRVSVVSLGVVFLRFFSMGLLNGFCSMVSAQWLKQVRTGVCSGLAGYPGGCHQTTSTPAPSSVLASPRLPARHSGLVVPCRG